MASAKTAPFWITASVALTANDTYTQTTIPLGSYIDVASKQAVAILQVDYIAQLTSDLSRKLAADAFIDFQLTDINRGALVAATDTAIVSSGSMAFNLGEPSYTNENDLYPDSFGTMSEARMVVNDDLFFGSQSDAAAGGSATTSTVRIKAMVVKLSEKDFMSLALTSVGSA